MTRTPTPGDTFPLTLDERMFLFSGLGNVFGNVTVNDDSGCWTWNGACTPQGYPVAWNPRLRRAINAHRWVAVVCGNDVSGDRTTHHRCLNRSCIRPWHLMGMDRAEHRRLHDLLRRRRDLKIVSTPGRLWPTDDPDHQPTKAGTP